MNIVDLGLVYDVEVEDGLVRINMTLTSPGCPAGPMITNDIYKVVRAIEGVNEHGDLPTPHFTDLLERSSIDRPGPHHRFQRRPAAQHASLHSKLRRHAVANGFDFLEAHIEPRIFLRAGAALEAGQLAVTESFRAGHGIE